MPHRVAEKDKIVSDPARAPNEPKSSASPPPQQLGAGLPASAPGLPKALCALVMGDPALQARLARASGDFAACASAVAAAHGIALAPNAFADVLRPDPLGLARWTVPPVTGTEWPSADWLPIEVAVAGGGVHVDWGYFGGAPIADAFFESALRRALANPFNRAFRYRMALGDFVAAGERAPAPAPAGFIFHMSRCGSTLAGQMLAALPDMSVVSEAAPVDAMARLCRRWPGPSADDAARCLAAMVRAFCRNAGRTVLKMHAWHTLMLPLFRRALPQVPWVFLYREPAEVLVSIMRQRGTEMQPGAVPPAFYGIAEPASGDEAYCAQVLEKICGAVVANHALGGGRLIAYHDLPDAVARELLPHFGVAPDAGDLAALQAAARDDPKSAMPFADDRDSKRAAITAAIREAVAAHLNGICAQLEALRAGQTT